ncbi:hypothetical protein FGG08_005989 [Glutinoglossum americanum]|uniref:DUF2415 domain-containing protein n=1 Tax=Glutinoglossum americanum TaxID=1670608 RepID=A0A9P8HTI6_9PEZI|nr:hypothetical protein FGG08_005989 [Glutinoglossum americanum]
MLTAVSYQETESLVLPEPRILYPAKIPVTHWQLRSLVSSPSPGLLYYPEDHFVYCLNTITRKRKLITCLPFSPRCLAVKYGWLCAGGADNGQFTAMKLPGSRYEDAVDPDLYLGLNDPWRGHPNIQQEGLIGSVVHTKELGGSIVNSVTIYRPRDVRDDRSTVAVFTNNDKSVRIFSLSQLTLITTLELEVAVNHASISPDGQHLVAVGDSQDVYFYKPTGSPSRSPDPNHRWEMYSNPPLRAGTDALFSTAFSPSSQLCAVASQDGTVTIFDTRYTDSLNHKAVVRSIPSSRPGTTAGAVRSISFSPDPWDLLVWTEHCGRICVLDTRDDFRSRQLIDLVAEADKIERAEVLCSPLEDLMDPRLRREQTDPAYIQSIYRQFREAHLAEHTIGGLSPPQGDDDALGDEPTPTTHTPETTSRDSPSSEQRPTSISYLPPPSASRGLNTSLRDYIRERNLQRDRDLPRYDSSRYLADARNDSNPSEAASASNPQRPQSQADSTDPWQTIEAAMATGRLLRDREVSFEANSQRRREVWMRWEERRRERLRGLHAEAEAERYIDRYRRETAGGDMGVGITGCSFGGDGRKL